MRSDKIKIIDTKMNAKGSSGKFLLFEYRADRFRKGLKEVIDSFERAKEWADLSNCLQKVKK